MSNLNLVGCNLVGAEGPLESPADPTVERYVDGPFYSWYDLASNNGFCSEQILQGLCHLHSFIEDNGPFDGAFGFSQGACMLTLLMQDDVVRLLNSRFGLHFTVGTHIEHASRGKGVVVDVRDDDSRGKPYSVRFDSGETHHYTIDQINAKNTRLQQQQGCSLSDRALCILCAVLVSLLRWTLTIREGDPTESSSTTDSFINIAPSSSVPKTH
jgi:hypothetical protein